CKIEHFNSNYSNLPNDNNDLNAILKDNYCKSNNTSEFIEWIPYNSLIDITFIDQGGFSKVYSALWLSNNLYEWNHADLEWKRLSGYKPVALKVLESYYNISEFLREVQSYYKIGFSHKITKLYGISKDPNTQNYILVLEYVKYGSLRKFLDKHNKYLLTSYKIKILKNIAEGINEIHSKGLIHQDIHSGNILNTDFDNIRITDLGLSKFVDQTSNNDNNEKEKRIYGNLPYIAPEVFQGQLYTQKADIYSFGIIINEVFTGKRPFYNMFDDELKIIIDICKNNLRPKIYENTPKSLIDLLNKCWNAEPSNRPTTDEIIQKLTYFEADDIIFKELRNFNNEILEQYFKSTDNKSDLKILQISKLHSIKLVNSTGTVYLVYILLYLTYI
ncbi:kinase-like domain-containing protein, partial [Glomus cerebriforme]